MSFTLKIIALHRIRVSEGCADFGKHNQSVMKSHPSYLTYKPIVWKWWKDEMEAEFSAKCKLQLAKRRSWKIHKKETKIQTENPEKLRVTRIMHTNEVWPKQSSQCQQQQQHQQKQLRQQSTSMNHSIKLNPNPQTYKR